MGFQGIGASVRRKEDVRFLSGKGNYTDDINRPGQLYAYIKRSDRPHATINGIDIAAASAAPGVVKVFVGADMAAEGVRERFVLIVGGPRINNAFAKELGYDAGFGPRTTPLEVASFMAQEVVRRHEES